MLSIQNALTGEGAPKILAPGNFESKNCKCRTYSWQLLTVVFFSVHAFSFFLLGRLFIREGPLLKVQLNKEYYFASGQLQFTANRNNASKQSKLAGILYFLMVSTLTKRGLNTVSKGKHTENVIPYF